MPDAKKDIEPPAAVAPPAKKELLPKAALILETQLDIDTGVNITDGAATRAYDLLKTGKMVTPEFSPAGKRAACFNNVENRVKANGGKVVYGWLVEPNRISEKVVNKFGDIA